MAYYDNISDADIHFTSSVPEGLEAYRFPCQTSTTENVSDADVDSTSSIPGELETYPFPGHMSATENLGDTEVYPISSMPAELETYPFLGQMSATENLSDANVHPTSFVPCGLEKYPLLSQISATEEVDFQADHTLADPWSMAEQSASHLASSTTGFGAATSYGTYHCHRSSRRLVPDAYLQSRWLPPRTSHTSTAMIGSYTSIIIGQPSANTPRFTTQTSWVKMFPSPTRHRKYPLQSWPPVVVRVFSTLRLAGFRVLTDHKQSHLTTGGRTRTSLLLARPMW